MTLRFVTAESTLSHRQGLKGTAREAQTSSSKCVNPGARRPGQLPTHVDPGFTDSKSVVISCSLFLLPLLACDSGTPTHRGTYPLLAWAERLLPSGGSLRGDASYILSAETGGFLRLPR